MPSLHHLHHAALDQVCRREVFNALTTQLDAALGHLTTLTLQQVGDGTQGGGLARAIATQERNNAPLWHLQ